MATHEQRIDALEGKVGMLEGRADALEASAEALTTKIDDMNDVMSGWSVRLERLITEATARIEAARTGAAESPPPAAPVCPPHDHVFEAGPEGSAGEYCYVTVDGIGCGARKPVWDGKAWT